MTNPVVDRAGLPPPTLEEVGDGTWAYVQLDGRRVSTRMTGKLTSSRRLVLTLRRGSWRHARRHGRLVVRVTTPGGVHVQRLRLPR